MLGARGPDPSTHGPTLPQAATAVLTVLPGSEAVARSRAANAAERNQARRGGGGEGGESKAKRGQIPLSAYITDSALGRVLGEARWQRLKDRSKEADFTPIEIRLSITIEASAARREFVSSNLVGLIPGKAAGKGAVLLLAHWDHLGECGPPEAADRICNGAVDNASGVAVMLELAQRLKTGPPLDRDIYVLATSAEEAGLLGTRAFIKSPPLPLGSIVAAFNFDMLALAPAGAPVGFIGRGRTSLDDVILGEIARSGRGTGDKLLAESFVTRQDGWALLEQGVPTVLLSSAFGSRAVLRPFLDSGYHQPSDEAGQIELGGAIDDLLLHEALVRILADPMRYSGKSAVQP